MRTEGALPASRPSGCTPYTAGRERTEAWGGKHGSFIMELVFGADVFLDLDCLLAQMPWVRCCLWFDLAIIEISARNYNFFDIF